MVSNFLTGNKNALKSSNAAIRINFIIIQFNNESVVYWTTFHRQFTSEQPWVRIPVKKRGLEQRKRSKINIKNKDSTAIFWNRNKMYIIHTDSGNRNKTKHFTFIDKEFRPK